MQISVLLLECMADALTESVNPIKMGNAAIELFTTEVSGVTTA